MDSSLSRYHNKKKIAIVDHKKGPKKEEIDVLIKIKKNKDNLCSSLLEIEKFLCHVNKACKINHLYKFLK